MSTPSRPPADLDLDISLPTSGPAPLDETRVLPPGALQQPQVQYEDGDATRAMPSTVKAAPLPAAPRSSEEDTIVRAAPLLPPAAATKPQATPAGSGPATLTPTGLGRSLPGSTGSDADGLLRQVGRYQIRSRLGRGGMATVYRAHDPGIGRDVAIKFLHASLAEDEECRTRFLREARAAGSLSHPHIATVHDVGEIEGRPFMAMELLEGRSLADVLDAQQVLPIRDVITLGLQLAQALEYAHGKGVVHRDIKPGNIMLLSDRSGIKVTDFGIAHIEGAGGVHAPTLVGAVLGTPQYMSPEQTRGEKLDGRSDLFSVGIVLFQALAGERPFKGENLVAVAQAIATAEPPPLNAKRPDVPPALRRVVDRCLAKQPEQRFASGAELSQALGRVLAELDAAAAAKDKPRIVPLRVKWALMMAAIVAAVMSVTGFVVTQRQYAALMAQASEYGAALTRFIAAQNAAAVLGEEWDAVDIAVQESMKTRNFERIVVIDKTGVVRASTVPGQAGQAYQPPPAKPLGTLPGGVKASRISGTGGAGAVLGFEAPVTYRDQEVGRVVLGVPERPLAEVARLSIMLMIVLVIVTVAAAAIAMLVLAKGVARPIALVAEGMGEMAAGRFGHRIGETRSDEFGALFSAFDDMAAALQQRGDGVARPRARPPTPGS